MSDDDGALFTIDHAGPVLPRGTGQLNSEQYRALITRPLPVKWDGVRVDWRDWRAEPDMFICGRGAEAARGRTCVKCGMRRDVTYCRGIRLATPPSIVAPRRRYMDPLYAFRCQVCGHDQVLDLGTGELWDLDPSDYGVGGSWVRS